MAVVSGGWIQGVDRGQVDGQRDGGRGQQRNDGRGYATMHQSQVRIESPCEYVDIENDVVIFALYSTTII